MSVPSKAVVFVEKNKVEVRTIELPAPQDDEILVKTLFSGVSAGTELWSLTGQYWSTVFPTVPGYQKTGVVEQVGSKVLNYKKLNYINLHTPKISEFSSIIAKDNRVRNILKNFQVKFSIKNKNCCIEGRDISTKILPNSDIKFFFKCNLKIAASRRYLELKKYNPKTNLKDVKKALRIRNILDTKRKYSPLLKHRNSIEIDTGKLSKSAVLSKMSRFVDKVLKQKYEG